MVGLGMEGWSNYTGMSLFFSKNVLEWIDGHLGVGEAGL
jgi:hypothetical protein